MALRRLLSCLLALSLLGAASPSLAEWPVPAALRAAVDGLEASQRAFVESGAPLLLLPEAQLRHELATRDAAGAAAFVASLMALADEMRYDASRDMGAIPLNLTTKEFNWGRVPTPRALRKGDREAGPFSVHRYLFPESGIPTFAGAPVAIDPEDLVAGSVDVAIIGVPSDMSSGRRGAAQAPHMMRAVNTIAVPDSQALIDPTQVLTIVDYGSFYVDQMSVERSVDHVTAMVAETAATGAVPMLVGGDTSVLYPGVKGVAEARGAGSFGLLHFSAHPDADRHAVHSVSDEQALFLLLDEGIVRGSDTIQVGLRGPAVNADTLGWLREQQVRYHTMAEIRHRGFPRVLDRVLSEVYAGPERFFVSIDVSVIEPAEMVSAGRVASDGLRV